MDYALLFTQFQSPISAFDCGNKCAPYNERSVPFCCDTNHAVPTAYNSEWEYFQMNTNLWHLWKAETPNKTQALMKITPPGQVLIECLGHLHCQRDFRSITCRAFPFFPYFSKKGDFLGLAYYWDYEDRCWIISNLDVVSNEYRSEFIDAYERIFLIFPQEKENFQHHSRVMRQVFTRMHKAIPLLHRNGFSYKISPRNERLRKTPLEAFPKFGPYKIASEIPFPDDTWGFKDY